MRILGIDPGPRSFAWAVYNTDKNDFDDWGTHIMPAPEFVTDGIDAVAIEDMVGIYMPGKDRANTAKMIGRLQEIFPGAYLIPRETIRAVLTGSARADEAKANRVLNKFIPSFAVRRRGLNGHHRAAACCAFVAVGRIQKAKVLQ